MAIIGKIRSKSGLLVGLVGVALLAFILSDYQSMLGFSEGAYGIGTVFGDKIDPRKYDETNQRVQMQDRQQSEQQGRPFGDTEMEAASDKAFNFLADSTILSKEYEKLGISVSEREFNAYLLATDGFTVLNDLNQFFTDSLTGLVTEQSTILGRQKLQTTINQLKTNKEPQAVQQWKSTEQYYTDRRKSEKYFALLTQGVYVTKLEAEQDYLAQKESKRISFVLKRYGDIADDEVKVTDEEIEKFYAENKNKSKYKVRTNSREVRVFDVVIAPSKSDSATMRKTMSQLQSEFSNSTNDSLFVMKNSDVRNYAADKRATAVPQGHEKAERFQTYPFDYDTIFKTATIGQVYGPYMMKESYVISKVLGFTPNSLKARHLLISTNGSTDKKIIDAKKQTADSLLKIINKTNFAELVQKHSDDPGSKEKGGEYDNFLEGEMVKEFGEFCATQPIGKIGVVKTDFGYHIIEVLDRGTGKFPLLASVSKVFKASEETIYSKESEVNRILYKLDNVMTKEKDNAKKVTLFDSIVRAANYFARPITIEDNNPKVYGFTTSAASDKILALAFAKDAAVGDLTSYPIKDKDKYILGMVTAIKEKGVPNYSDVKEQMRRDLIEEKKAQKLMNMLAKGKSMDEISKKANVPVMSADITFGNPSIMGAGYEPEIIGSLFSVAVKDGSRTLPLKGKTGVYVVKIEKTTKAPAAANYNIERDQLLNNLKGSLQGQAMMGLRKAAEIVDNRKLNELRIRL
jgi:peptidyl-prolyl cis-trans isomerase D